MRILALDTATEACSAAVLCAAADERCAAPDQRCAAPDQRCAATNERRGTPGLFFRYEEPGRGHAERILAMIDAVLHEAQLALASLDAIAFGRGPGGFTGVRLAASVAQGLAFAVGLPVVPVSDLRAVAQRALDGAADAQRVLVCADARMREVYWGCFRRGTQGLAEPFHGAPERVSSPDTVDMPRRAERAAACEPPPAAAREHAPASEGADVAAGPIVGAGSGFSAYPQLQARLAAHLSAIRGDLLPRAPEIARLAAADLAAGLAVAPHEAVPIYLRDDVARPSAGR